MPEVTSDLANRPAPGSEPVQRPAVLALTGVAGIVIAVGTALGAAALSGAAAPELLADPGPMVRWGLVAVRVLADLAAALAIGALILAAVAIPPSKRPDPRPSKRPDQPADTPAAPPLAHRPALLLASVAATGWGLAHVVLLVFSFANVLGTSLDGPDIGTQLVSFTRDSDAGRYLGVTALAAGAIGLLAAGATRLRSAGLLAVAAMLVLIPTALSGHSGASNDHETAVTSLGLHVLAASVWAGGLLALVLLAPGLSGPAVAATTRRYSTLAGWSFVAVAGSGLLNSWLRLGGLGGVTSAYGGLLIAKAIALLALGGFGYLHRSRSLQALDGGARLAFARIATVELAVMAVAFGLAAALSRTAPPSTVLRTTDLAESITGYPLPPAPTPASWFTAWQPDLLWVLFVVLAAVGYLAGVRRLRARGDRWAPSRVVVFLAGLALLGYVTCGYPAVYGRVLFSGHMLMHMLLTMVVPPLLVLGAPLTLALRVLPARHDASRGPREWMLALLGSRALQVLAFPPVAAALFAGSLVAFYYSDLFRLALTTHVGHELMHVHFLLTGYLFAWVLIGIDPGPRRLGFPFRLVLLFATMAFHAFFFLALMDGSAVLQPDFFGGLGRTWGRGLLADQQFGGGIGWGIGEVPTLVLAIVLAVQWSRSDERDAKRYDRSADRDGDAELSAYNEMLAKLANRSRS